MPQQPDPEIMKLLRNKQYEQAFNLMVKNYQERLYWHVRKMLYFHEDADDALQNTFVKVWRNIKKFKGDSRIYTWLYRIATNEALNIISQNKKRHLSSDNEQKSLAQKLVSDAYFDGDEAEAKLIEAIAKLPEKQRLVFQMKYYDNMKYDDISEILQTSVGALKASYHHAVNKIKESLIIKEI